MSAVVVRVSRRFDVTPERVFDAWLDPATVGRWLFARPDGAMQGVEIHAGVGGGFTIVERRAQGDAAHYGRYVEIDRPQRLVFLFAVEPGDAGDRVTVEIVRDGDGCVLTLTHEMSPEYASYEPQTRSGWAMVLDSLARQLDHA